MWNKKIETMSADEMQTFQVKKLRETAEWVCKNVPYYKKKFSEMGIDPQGIGSLEDLAALPFTVKSTLRNNYPFGLCALPPGRAARIHSSSGATGEPIPVTYTEQDLDQWGECMARTLCAAGVSSQDICQNSHEMGLFTGGLGFQQGAAKVGCCLIPAGGGAVERQVTIIRDFGVTALFGTPSFALTIAEKARDMGVDLRPLPIRVGIFGAEPWSLKMRREIEERMGIKAHEAYGLTEMMGPGVSFDCEAQDGYLHINEDHVLPEVIDPVTEETLPPGERGELVLTAIQRRAMPLIRFRTRDITELKREKCACGRGLIKMKKVVGRLDDMIIISGINVFPSQIESLLLEVEEVEPQYVLIIRKKGYLDALSVDVEAKPEAYAAGEEKLKETEGRIEGLIRGTIGISVKVRCVPPKSIERSQGKAKRVFDTRKM